MTEAKRSKSIPPRNTAQAIYNQMHAAQVSALQATCEHAFSTVTSVCVRCSIPLAQYAKSRAAQLFADIQITKDQTNPMTQPVRGSGGLIRSTCLCGGKLKSEGRGPAPGDASARHSEIACEGYNQYGWARIVGPAPTPPVQTSIDSSFVMELMQDAREQALIDYVTCRKCKGTDGVGAATHLCRHCAWLPRIDNVSVSEKPKSRFSTTGRKWLPMTGEPGKHGQELDKQGVPSCLGTDSRLGWAGVWDHPRNLRGKVNVPALALEDLDDLLCEVK